MNMKMNRDAIKPYEGIEGCTRRNTKVGKVFVSLFTVSSVLAVALVALVPTQASAVETPDHCIAIIGATPTTPNTVRGNLLAIYNANGIGGNNIQRTYESLDSKLSGAIAKIQQKKYIPDADKKLSDFIEQVQYISDTSTTPKVKLSADDAKILLYGAASTSGVLDDIGAFGARDCVRDLP